MRGFKGLQFILLLWLGLTQHYQVLAVAVDKKGELIFEATQQLDSDRAVRILQNRINGDELDFEAQLLLGLVHMKRGELNMATEVLQKLVEVNPKFHLAHLVLGDIYLLQGSQSLQKLGETPLMKSLAGGDKPLDDLRHEAQQRLNAFLNSPQNNHIPRAMLQLNDDVETAIIVEKSTHRLYRYRWDRVTQRPQLIDDYYVSTAQLNGNKQKRGDLKTPEGVYFIISHIPDSKLPDKYGVSAYPMDYPNEFDRRLGKTGYGIWLHGTASNFYSRPPLDSEGCVVLPNIDLTQVRNKIEPGKTPIIVAERIEWLEEQEWRSLHNSLLAAIERWKSDWESGDVERYLAHYAEDFWAKGYNLNSWKKRKRRISRSKEYQRVDVKDLSIFSYPRTASGGREMVVANFYQTYESNNYRSHGVKRLYLVNDNGAWQVLYEGSL